MHVTSFATTHVAEAAQMFAASFAELRRTVPALPGEMANVDGVAARLADVTGVAAVEGDRLLGYLAGWYPIEGFRDTVRAGAYVPEWGHGSIAHDRAAVDTALYRAASSAWTSAGCEVHAITVLAGDDLDGWFWRGFGMGPVDAIRPMTPIGAPMPDGCAIRRAVRSDAPDLAVLDEAHRRHYTAPPVFMPFRTPDDAEAWRTFLARPGNSVWLAEDDDGPFGFLRLGPDFGGSDVLASPTGVFISGAYVRPTHRRRGVAAALLDAALGHHAAEGLAACAVDFEAFNPEAAGFWLRYFTPACFSLLRIPETTQAPP